MIVANCILIGIAAAMTRSALSIAVAAVLIGLTFVAAALYAMSAASVLALLSAIAGFNIGLMGVILGGVVFGSRTSPTAR